MRPARPAGAVSSGGRLGVTARSKIWNASCRQAFSLIWDSFTCAYMPLQRLPGNLSTRAYQEQSASGANCLAPGMMCLS